MSENHNNSNVLLELERWKLEAKNEDNSRYFSPVDQLDPITRGDAIYVIGRKGCGKTAIAEHIRGTSSHNIFVISMSFKNFPFNDLYSFTDKRFTSRSQYITLWKYIIYSAICQKMAINENIDSNVKSSLIENFDFDFERGLSRTLKVITQKTGSLSVLKAGITGGVTKTFIPNDTPWSQRVDGLEQLIENYIDNSHYYILFDELDEDYKDILKDNSEVPYFDLISGLFKAVHDIHSIFKKTSNIRPVAFLRDDIFSLIQNNDKGKWDELSVNLTWTPPRLEALIAFRISRAIDPSGIIYGFSEALEQVFSSDTIRHGHRSKHRRHIFKHILDRTLIRPRDVISYIREAAKIARASGQTMISPSIMRAADRNYSMKFRQEFVDEIHAILPRCEDVFNLFSRIRKQSFSIRELEIEYNETRKKYPEMLDFESTINLLFHFSIIGNQPSQKNTTVFKYRDSQSEFNSRENIIIHRGLLRSLQIT